MTKQEIRNAWFKEIEAQKEATNFRCERDIEKYRKGDKKIVLKNKDGKTLANKNVAIHQKSHAFNFGANIFMLDEFSEEKDNRSIAARLLIFVLNIAAKTAFLQNCIAYSMINIWLYQIGFLKMTSRKCVSCTKSASVKSRSVTAVK